MVLKRWARWFGAASPRGKRTERRRGFIAAGSGTGIIGSHLDHYRNRKVPRRRLQSVSQSHSHFHSPRIRLRPAMLQSFQPQRLRQLCLAYACRLRKPRLPDLCSKTNSRSHDIESPQPPWNPPLDFITSTEITPPVSVFSLASLIQSHTSSTLHTSWVCSLHHTWITRQS